MVTVKSTVIWAVKARVVWYTFTDVSEEHTAFIFSVEE
jgi:hypothetical protein